MPVVPAELVVRNWLATRFPSARLVTETPGNLAAVVPCIQVVRFGGTDDVATIDDANVDVDYFAETRDEARQGAEDVRSALRFEMPGDTVSGAFVLRVTTISAPAYVPYLNSSLRRFHASYQIRLHAN